MKSDLAKVLIIDDEVYLRDIWSELFSMLNQDSILACSASEGIARIRDERVLFIVTDLMMPESTGLEVLDYLQNNPERRVPAFVCSGYLEEDASELSDYDVERIIPKPFSVMKEMDYFAHYLKVLREE